MNLEKQLKVERIEKQLRKDIQHIFHALEQPGVSKIYKRDVYEGGLNFLKNKVKEDESIEMREAAVNVLVDLMEIRGDVSNVFTR